MYCTFIFSYMFCTFIFTVMCFKFIFTFTCVKSLFSQSQLQVLYSVHVNLFSQILFFCQLLVWMPAERIFTEAERRETWDLFWKLCWTKRSKWRRKRRKRTKKKKRRESLEELLQEKVIDNKKCVISSTSCLRKLWNYNNWWFMTG